jgi:hypothetical protein
MTQLSRPFQIVLAATVLFAVVWFVALSPHGQSSSSTPVASTPVSTPAPTSQSPVAGASTKIYHGAAPGVEGLTRDIHRAHGNVAAAQSQAQKAASASAESSGKGAGVVSASTTVTKSKPAGASGSAAQTSKSTTTVVHPKHASVPAGTVTKSSVTVTGAKRVPGGSVTVTKTAVHAAPAQQVAVEKQLKQGKVVLVLFWNPKGSDDVAVHKELAAVEKKLGGKIAVHYALTDQVASFGSITKAIQVYQTPTILMVNGKGLTTTLTGFTDAFAIEQTIKEARQA